MKKNKGFTLIELLAVIVILAIIALIVTPVVSNIVANARIAANARSVEGHIRNIEIAIISEAFSGTTTGDLDSYDNITSGTTIESSLTIPDNDNVTCSSYEITHGKVLSANGCTDNLNEWDKSYSYSSSTGAYVFEFKGTIEAPKTGETHLGIVYMDPSNIKNTCTANSTLTSGNTGCKKFYIYKDTGTQYKMIMDRNTTTEVAWINKTDYLANGGTESDWNSGKYTKIGTGYTALARIAADTVGWIGSPDLISADDIASIIGAKDTVGWTSTTATEWIFLDGGSNSNPNVYSSGSYGWQRQVANSTTKSKYAWLYDHTLNCTNSGCNTNQNNTYGYWTKEYQYNSNSNGWVIYNNGALTRSSVNDGNIFGVRPVLTVDKSLIR